MLIETLTDTQIEVKAFLNTLNHCIKAAIPTVFLQENNPQLSLTLLNSIHRWLCRNVAFSTCNFLSKASLPVIHSTHVRSWGVHVPGNFCSIGLLNSRNRTEEIHKHAWHAPNILYSSRGVNNLWIELKSWLVCVTCLINPSAAECTTKHISCQLRMLILRACSVLYRFFWNPNPWHKYLFGENRKCLWIRCGVLSKYEGTLMPPVARKSHFKLPAKLLSSTHTQFLHISLPSRS